MILVGESIHVGSKEVSAALRMRDSRPIQKLAQSQVEAGADFLDLNLGPLNKDPGQIAQWVVYTVQSVVDTPLSIDTINLTAMEAALKICKVPPLINSANASQSSKETVFPIAKKYSADLIVMTFTDEGMPNDADERIDCVMDIVEYADHVGIPREKIWIDGVLMPACVNQQQVTQYIEFVKMFEELGSGARLITGLSNISSCGTAQEHRGILNRALFVLLKRYGHSALIADVLDEELGRLNRGELPQIEGLIHRAEDGEDIELAELSDTEKAYVKTVDVLLGRQLYSHSWLEE